MNTQRRTFTPSIAETLMDSNCGPSAGEVIVIDPCGNRLVMRPVTADDGLSIREVQRRTRLSAREILQGMARKEFPKPIGPCATWSESDLDDWIADRPVVTELPPFEEFK